MKERKTGKNEGGKERERKRELRNESKIREMKEGKKDKNWIV